jgi:hypothetical protein
MILREAIFSERNADILWGVCEAQHLSEDKIYKIATLAGDVLLGFVHSEDFEKEIKQELGLNPEIAKIISQEVDRKIFSPIKSEIDKAYAMPLTSEEEVEEAEGGEITEPVVTDIRRETGGVKITKEVEYAQPAEVEPMRIVGSGGEEKLVIPGAEEQPISESASIEPTKPAPTTSEEPIVLHKEEEIKTAFGDANKKPLGELFGFLNGKESAVKKESASVASEVELGGEKTDEPVKTITTDIVGKADEQAERVVHYDSALSTPITPVEVDKTNMTNVTDKINEFDAVDKAEKKKPWEFFKAAIQKIKPTVKVVDFVEEKKEEIPEEIKKTDIAEITDGTDKTYKSDIIETTETPKIIAEESEKQKELKEEIKEELEKEPQEESLAQEKKKKFFARLFGKMKKVDNNYDQQG